MSGILSKKDIPTSKDIYWSDSEKKLLVNLLSFEKYTVQQGSQIPEFRKLVWAIQMTSQQINHVVQNILKSNMLFSNQMTLIVVGTIMILNVFDSLGITSSEGTLLRDIQNTIDQTVNS